ncbi:hypothetical protein JOB18_012258 [Solea senegalensis]|uniref:Secreted protein n=1 Tax=Solea senegalensis TaxID=28829 RepID=A0AAV6R251_SOLSE|nr:hypothetical protein JOB18_012258 [Solea senegalensis]
MFRTLPPLLASSAMNGNGNDAEVPVALLASAAIHRKKIRGIYEFVFGKKKEKKFLFVRLLLFLPLHNNLSRPFSTTATVKKIDVVWFPAR